ncbi:MAG: choice-of-anchor tandem repeat GloVer-containing protein [Candidatus Korobacteraceae bacterium]
MGNVREVRSLISGLSLGAATAALALAIVFVLTVATSGAANAQSFQVIYNFTGGPDGAQPYAGLVMRGKSLYGTTFSGNEGSNWGDVYQLRQVGSGWIFTQLQLFDGTLSAGVTFGPDGTLYGTSPNNIAGYKYGYIYNLTPGVSAVCVATHCPWVATVLYAFSGGSDGASPRYGSLIFDQAGNFYGTTSVGGSSGNGVVYKMSPSGGGWTEQPMYSFAGTPDGANPYGGLVFDNAGNLYGMTTQGGSGGFGAVFEVSPSGGSFTEKVIYNFQGASDGDYPTAGLIFDNAGNLYGTTSDGGTGGGGTVFELTPSGGSWSYNLIYSFTGGARCGPWGTLTLDGAGNLYGTTVCDGANNAGNVFELSPSGGGGWTYSSLHDFTGGNDGRRAYGNVTIDPAGNLYGTASRGGTHDNGVIWEYTP